MRRKGALFLLVAVAMVVSALSGCSGSKDDIKGQTPISGDKPPISSEPTNIKEKVILYFGDEQAMYLVPQEREVSPKEGSIAHAVVLELIKGPEGEKLKKTIPDGTKLLSLSVVDGTAYVNFSQEIKTNHWGGSTGETFTIYSVVNSLCKLEGIKSVQFLIDGKKTDTLAGHYELTQPFTPDWNLVAK